MTQVTLNSSHTLPRQNSEHISHSLTHGPSVNRTFVFQREEKFIDECTVSHQSHKQNKKTT